MSKLAEVLESLKFEIAEVLDNFTDFLDTFFNDVMGSEMSGLIMYLWSCIPSFIRNYLFFTVILFIILMLYFTIRHDN